MKGCTILRGSSTLRRLTTAVEGHTPEKDSVKWKPIRMVGQDGHGAHLLRSSVRIEPSETSTDSIESSTRRRANVEKVLAGIESEWAYPPLSREHGTTKNGTSAGDEARIPFEPSKTMSQFEAGSESSFNLPKSPLMDPAFLQAREKYRATKEPPSKLDTQLQQELAKNPFALALASPLRTCGWTDVRLPRYFFQDFKVLSHPDTTVPHLLPTSLTRKYSKEGDIPKEAERTIEGMTGYVVANGRTFASMQDSKKLSTRAHYDLFPNSLRSIKPAMDMLHSSRWRPDMGDFVLELMRRRCVENLVHLATLKRGYLVGCANWEDAASKPSVAAFVWTGGREDDVKDALSDFATLDLGMEGGLKGGEKKKKRKVPVYNLRSLLGQEKLASLRDQSTIFERDMVALKHKKMTVGLEMKLWKLQGYVADYDKIVEDRESSGGTEFNEGLEDDDFDCDEDMDRDGDGDGDKDS